MSDLFNSLQTALADTYQLERELGRGGMATVYLARELKHPRHVAIKVLRPELVGVLARERFLREIRISSEFTHPHILPLLDSGTVPASADFPALPFYTMPYVEGEALRARLAREKQLPVEDALVIARDVAAALGYAHARGVVHRDIKPENILLIGGQAIVADFGIARAIQEAVDPDALTSAGLVIGTPAYMSPEQAGGETTLDGRSDLYSLGCVLYEMLGGEPPFTGPSVQAVLARHRLDSAPSLSTIRQAVPPSIERAVMRALAKSPADRFATAEQFADALSGRLSGEEPHPDSSPRWVRPAFLLLVVVAVVVTGWWVRTRGARQLNPNTVVVFPLAETPAGSIQEGTGIAVALMIGTALEYTDPLVWIDAEPRLGAGSRRDVGLLTLDEARHITLDAGARWFLDGSLVRHGDSTTVVLRLNDAQGDSLVQRASATRLSAQVAQAGLEAVNHLLPRLLAPGQQMADLAALAERRPSAVALWLQGEREYRRFNFTEALAFDQRAIAEDSALAVAAIRGAQAANWLNETAEFTALSDLALRHLSLLPGRMEPFARGLHAYASGQADSAVTWLTRALEADPEWTEAHMSLGEVYYHLLPSVQGRLDSLAEREFHAAAADSGFSPARFHLAEIAIRSGDTTRAKVAVEDFLRLARGEASAEQRNQLRVVLACVLGGRSGVNWRAEVAANLPVVFGAATILAAGGAYPGCGEDSFRAVFDQPDAPLGYRWGAFLGLQGLLAAEGRATELRTLIASAIAAGLDLADQLYIFDALAGVEVAPEAATVAVRTSRNPGGERLPFVLWLAGEWFAQADDALVSGALRSELALRATQERGQANRRLAEVLGTRLLLLRGDTAAAIRDLRGAHPFGRSDQLAWGVGESMAPDRLLLARLLLATGQPQEAISVASGFDHPQPIGFLPYLPASLSLRREAAVALGREAEARSYEKRLAALGERRELVGGNTLTTQEAQ